MEKSMRQLRKFNTSVDPREDLINFCCQDQPQKALFQVSETEVPFPLQMRPVNVDPWFTSEQDNRFKEPMKPAPYFRRTVHLRGNKVQRWQAVQRDLNSDPQIKKSIIPRLKNLLQKLESPQKKNQRDIPIIQNSIFLEQNIETVKQTQKSLVKSHNVSIRIINHSSEKRYRKVGKSFKEGKTQLLFSRKKSGVPDAQDLKADFQQHLALIRQARRKRTLKNLLF